MSIIEKAFHYNESKINVVKCNDDIWFKGRDIANALGYENPGKAIRIPSIDTYHITTIHLQANETLCSAKL